MFGFLGQKETKDVAGSTDHLDVSIVKGSKRCTS